MRAERGHMAHSTKIRLYAIAEARGSIERDNLAETHPRALLKLQTLDTAVRAASAADLADDADKHASKTGPDAEGCAELGSFVRSTAGGGRQCVDQREARERVLLLI